MIEIETNKAKRDIKDAEATNGVYGLNSGEKIISAKIYNTTKVPDFGLMCLPDLESVIIDEGVTQRSFQNDSALKTIVFPASLISIEYDSFEGCQQELIDSFPDSIKSLLDKAKEEKAEKDKLEKKRREQERQEHERQQARQKELDEMWRQKRQEEKLLKVQREKEERERLNREIEEANIPKNPEEEMLVRVFGEEISLYVSRDKRKPLFYKLDMEVPFSNQHVKIEIQFAEKGSRAMHQVSVYWHAYTWDIDDFDEYYLVDVMAFLEGLKSIGMKASLKSSWFEGEDDDDFDFMFMLDLNGKIKKNKKDIEQFLVSLLGIVNYCDSTNCSSDDILGFQHEFFKDFLEQYDEYL